MVQIKYPVFLQALVLSIVVVLIGMYMGISIEQGKFEKINGYYGDSETMLLDVLALDSLIGTVNISCDNLEKSSVDLLDKIYNESIILDDFRESSKLTNALKTVYKKYSSLRGYLWIDAIKIKKKCKNSFNTVIYLYNYDEQDLTKSAEQNVWSKVLFEVKRDNANDVLLIPITANTGLESLNILMDEYNITSIPSVIVNEKYIFNKISTAKEITSKFY